MLLKRPLALWQISYPSYPSKPTYSFECSISFNYDTKTDTKTDTNTNTKTDTETDTKDTKTDTKDH